VTVLRYQSANLSVTDTAAVTVSRTNYNLNPAFVGNTAWTLGGAGGTDVAWAGDGTVTWTAWPGSALAYEATAIPATPGDVWSVSRQVTVPVGSPALTVCLALVWYSGQIINQGSYVTINPGETATLALAGVVCPSGQTGLRTILYHESAAPANGSLITGQAMVEKAATVGAFFDGDTTAAGDYTYAWTGTANASASQQLGGTYSYNVEGGTITFDESWTPYLQANVTLTLPMKVTLPPAIDQPALDALDPRNGLRATLVCTLYEYDEATGTLHSQNDVSASLRISGRTVDWKAGTVALVLGTDEFALQTEANRTIEPVNYRAYQSSLIAVCNAVLADAGVSATLDASSVDADVTTLTSVTNMIDNPNVTGGYDLRAVNCTLDSNDTSWFTQGTNSINAYSPTNSDSYVEIGPTLNDTSTTMAFGMEAGKTYTLSGDVRVKVAGTGTDYVGPVDRARGLVIHTRRSDNDGNYLSTYDVYSSGNLPNTVGATERMSLTFTLAPTVVSVGIRLYCGNSASQQVQFDGLMLTEGDGKETDGVNLLPYFDGSTSADSHYTYAWSGTADQSSSSRTPRFDRSLDSLTVSPGQSYMDMLTPVLSAAGLRLFCDEDGIWRLVSGTDYALPETVIVQQSNATQLADAIDLTQPDVVYNSVVVKYTWVDASGVTETYYDAAGTGSPTRLVELDNTPFPGAGAAAYGLKRGQGRGRVMTTTAMTDYSARPYQGARIIAPYTQTQTGVVSRINFDLSSAEMDVTTRGLIDTPDGAWVLAPDDVTWNDASDTTTWDGLDNDFSNLT